VLVNLNEFKYHSTEQMTTDIAKLMHSLTKAAAADTQLYAKIVDLRVFSDSQIEDMQLVNKEIFTSSNSPTAAPRRITSLGSISQPQQSKVSKDIHKLEQELREIQRQQQLKKKVEPVRKPQETPMTAAEKNELKDQIPKLS
jgi:hypothetical protein